MRGGQVGCVWAGLSCGASDTREGGLKGCVVSRSPFSDGLAVGVGCAEEGAREEEEEDGGHSRRGSKSELFCCWSFASVCCLG